MYAAACLWTCTFFFHFSSAAILPLLGQSAGAALSTTYAGILAARFNYSAAFIGLAFMAFAALFVFIFSYKFVKGFTVKSYNYLSVFITSTGL